MVRWEPDARGRLERAALELFAERGYDATTVGEIAARAGVTSRTYFRYHPDKREVLFDGARELQAAVVDAVTAAPAGLPPLAAVLHGARAAASVLRPRDLLDRRAAVIAAAPELQERENAKLSILAAALTAALERRGTDPLAAGLAADTGIAVLKVATAEWRREPGLDFDAAMDRAIDRFAAIGAPLDAAAG